MSEINVDIKADFKLPEPAQEPKRAYALSEDDINYIFWALGIATGRAVADGNDRLRDRLSRIAIDLSAQTNIKKIEEVKS